MQLNVIKIKIIRFFSVFLVGDTKISHFSGTKFTDLTVSISFTLFLVLNKPSMTNIIQRIKIKMQKRFRTREMRFTSFLLPWQICYWIDWSALHNSVAWNFHAAHIIQLTGTDDPILIFWKKEWTKLLLGNRMLSRSKKLSKNIERSSSTRLSRTRWVYLSLFSSLLLCFHFINFMLRCDSIPFDFIDRSSGYRWADASYALSHTHVWFKCEVKQNKKEAPKS